MELLNRTIGIEMEGYVTDFPHDIYLPHKARIGKDESLNNCYWEEDYEPYGIEAKTAPFTNLQEIKDIFNKLSDCGWSTNDDAGTHIHVDISDYSMFDKIKLLRFGKAIEPIMYSLAQDYRFDNDYCETLPETWKSVLNSGISWDQSDSGIKDELNRKNYYNSKYHWMNVFGSQYPTVEFRIFHAVHSLDELIAQAKLVHGIVELVKNSTVEQMVFIIQSIFNSENALEVVSKFFEAVGVEPMTTYSDGYEQLASILKHRAKYDVSAV